MEEIDEQVVDMLNTIIGNLDAPQAPNVLRYIRAVEARRNIRTSQSRTGPVTRQQSLRNSRERPRGHDELLNNLLSNQYRQFIPAFMSLVRRANMGRIGAPVRQLLAAENTGIGADIEQFINRFSFPLPNHIIEAMPTKRISKCHRDAHMACSVCLEEFKLIQKVKVLACEHIFHVRCILPWFKMNSTCPLCRTRLY